MVSFFDTQAAQVVKTQIESVDTFYRLIEKLIVDAGLATEALTIFDLEKLILQVPGATQEVAIAISEFATNNGREYISAHEIRTRAKEHANKMFKVAYCSFLMYHKKVNFKQLVELWIVDAPSAPQDDSERDDIA